jgi:hypothetical protein
MHSILDELEDAAVRLDARGRKEDAAEVRDIIEFAFHGPHPSE